MGKSHLKIYTILLISNLCAIAIGEVLVKLENRCACEQLINENECNSNKICNYSNDKCSTIKCNLLSAGNCGSNTDCALVDNQCVDFKSCASHNAKTQVACSKLYHDCYFDDQDNTCLDPKPLKLGSCSENLFSICLAADEGLCVRKNGVCQEMTVCEDASPDSLQCLLSFLACEMTDDKCISHLSCSQAEWVDCKFAKEKVNGDRFYLCMRGPNGCLDFDPKQQTKDTCFNNSLTFYHWDGSECSRCSWDSIIQSILFVALLILSI